MSVLKQCIRNKKFLLSAIILIPLLFVALFGNLLISHDPLEINATQTLAPPSQEYPMGTDEYGRCIACRLVVGIQPTMELLTKWPQKICNGNLSRKKTLTGVISCSISSASGSKRSLKGDSDPPLPLNLAAISALNCVLSFGRQRCPRTRSAAS